MAPRNAAGQAANTQRRKELGTIPLRLGALSADRQALREKKTHDYWKGTADQGAIGLRSAKSA